jgi:hypothetical protein
MTGFVPVNVWFNAAEEARYAYLGGPYVNHEVLTRFSSHD